MTIKSAFNFFYTLQPEIEGGGTNMDVAAYKVPHRLALSDGSLVQDNQSTP